MKNDILPGFTIVNSIFAVVIFGSKSFTFRGVELYGVSKNAFAVFITCFWIATLLNEFNKSCSNIKYKNIVMIFVLSPFFLIWIFSILYFSKALVWLKYVPYMNFPLFLIIYFSMLLSLFYFYNKLINKLELLNEQNKPVNEQSKSKKKKNRRKKKHTMK